VLLDFFEFALGMLLGIFIIGVMVLVFCLTVIIASCVPFFGPCFLYYLSQNNSVLFSPYPSTYDLTEFFILSACFSAMAQVVFLIAISDSILT
jgi:hypothetical protein